MRRRWSRFAAMAGLFAFVIGDAKPARSQQDADPEEQVEETRTGTEPDSETEESAGAEPAPETGADEEREEEPAEEPLSAEDVAGAPRPGAASGIARPAERGPVWLLWIPRALLFPPRVAFEVADAPVRGAIYAYYRYNLQARAKRIFFNTEGTVGLFPTLFIETGFGLNAGARFIHKDLFGQGEGLRARAGFGGRFEQIYAASLDSGERFSEDVSVKIEGLFEVRPKDTFYGIGDLDEVDRGDVAGPVDPRQIGVKSRFQQDVARVGLSAELDLPGYLEGRITSAYLYRAFGTEGEFDRAGAIDELYMTSGLAAFEEGVSSAALELGLRYDSRRAVSRWESEPQPGTGGVIGGFLGAAGGIGDDPTNYLRYGVDLQRYFRLGPAPRVIALRAFYEGVIGARSAIPFTDLPRLGGAKLLRGYQSDRFRDRHLALYTAEYQYDLNRKAAGVLFVDAGRVFGSAERVFDRLGDYRVGYGAALQLHTRQSFIGRLTVASSIDGGLFVNFSVDPIYDPDSRVERK